MSCGVNLTPSPAGIVEFGNFSGVAGSGPVGIPFRFAKPSRCTVFIQKSLLVDWVVLVADPILFPYFVLMLSAKLCSAYQVQ